MRTLPILQGRNSRLHRLLPLTLAIIALTGCQPRVARSSKSGAAPQPTSSPSAEPSPSPSPSNAAPTVGNDQTLTTDEDTPLAITLNAGSDPEGNPLSYILTAAPAQGTLTQCMDQPGSSNAQDKTCSYTPPANWNGTVSFSYKVNDGAADSATSATVQITAAAVNDLPIVQAIPDQITSIGTAISDLPFTVDEGGLADEDAQNLTITATSSDTTLIPNGNISVTYAADNAADATGGSLTLTPAAGQSGTATITLTVTDNGTPNESAQTQFDVTVQPATASHGGWSDVVAVGRKSDGADNELAPRSNTIKWNAFTPSSGAISAYKIFRATSSGAQNFASPIHTTPDAATLQYQDLAVAAGTSYYYVVRPVIDGATLATSESYAEIKVTTPPDNMVLVHRWIANQEICGLLGKAPDPANHYRCSYGGAGFTGTHYDIGYSFVHDMQEQGCNYTGGTSYNGGPAIGIVAPNNGYGNIGDVYYGRDSGNCYIKTAPAVWSTANATSATLTAADRASLSSNRALLPPLVRIDQARSWDTCQAQTVLIDGAPLAKRLFRRKEQIAASAWPSTLSDATIASTEAGGAALATSHYCNSNYPNGLTYEDTTPPTDPETLPGISSTGPRSVRTGGPHTTSCKTRYGAQDMIGNVWEWLSDQVGTCDGTANICSGVASTLDTENNDFAGFHFDGTMGPGGASAGGTVTSFGFASGAFDVGRFLLPLGLPLVTGATSFADSLAIGAGEGQMAAAKFHGDVIWVNTNQSNGTPARGARFGGAWNQGQNFGRYTLGLYYTPTTIDTIAGFRCTVPLP